MIKFHNGADAATVQQPPTTQTRLPNTATQFKFSTTRDFKLKLCPHCLQQSSTHKKAGSLQSMERLCKIEKQDKLNPRKPVKTRDCHQDESFSPASSLYLDLESCGWGWASIGAGEGPIHFNLLSCSLSPSTKGPRQEFFRPGAGDPTFLQGKRLRKNPDTLHYRYKLCCTTSIHTKQYSWK